MENSELQYNEEFKNMLDNRYKDSRDRKIEMISEEESREEILQLLAMKDNFSRVS